MFLTFQFSIQKPLSKTVVINVLASASELYTWKADFSQLRNQKVKPKIADFDGILARQF
jgi:hypothetical protein